MVQLGGDHQRGAAAVVGSVDTRAAVDEQVYDLLDVENAGAVAKARYPHQRGQVVAVAGVDIDVRREQAAHNRRKSERGGVEDRCLTGRVDRVRIGALRQQQLHDALVALKAGGRERRDAGASRQVRIGALVEQQGKDRKGDVLGGGRGGG